MKKLIILIIMLGSVMGIILLATSNQGNPKPLSSWLWSSPDMISGNETVKMLNQARKMHIDTVYVDISKYVDIISSDSEVENYSVSLALFNATAAAKKIKVQALAGHPDWSQPDEQYLPLEIVSFVNKFNSKYPESRFSGIQFDIEFWNRPGFNENSLSEYQFFQELADDVISQHKSLFPDLPLGFAVPFWTENELTFPLAQKLSVLPESYLVVMAYRNYAQGSDGTIEIIKDEFDYFSRNRLPTKLFIGQETTDVQPVKITFFGQTHKHLDTEINSIYKHFSSQPNFGGFAIHDLPGFIALP